MSEFLDTLGPLLNAREMARIFGVTVSQFYRRERSGEFTVFQVSPALGLRRYSKSIVLRYLAGEAIDRPERVFGRKRRSRHVA